jgi:hypothetical protein
MNFATLNPRERLPKPGGRSVMPLLPARRRRGKHAAQGAVP